MFPAKPARARGPPARVLCALGWVSAALSSLSPSEAEPLLSENAGLRRSLASRLDCRKLMILSQVFGGQAAKHQTMPLARRSLARTYLQNTDDAASGEIRWDKMLATRASHATEQNR